MLTRSFVPSCAIPGSQECAVSFRSLEPPDILSPALPPTKLCPTGVGSARFRFLGHPDQPHRTGVPALRFHCQEITKVSPITPNCLESAIRIWESMITTDHEHGLTSLRPPQGSPSPRCLRFWNTCLGTIVSRACDIAGGSSTWSFLRFFLGVIIAVFAVLVGTNWYCWRCFL